MENSAQHAVLCREIHKNGILKKYNTEKRTGFARKCERVWAVFCVHDDTEAFLEFYADQKMALNHKPNLFVSLHNAHHISPSICATSDEYEFAVTLPTQVVRLAANTWETMMEWVETIRNKLRELRVLAPKENVYSKMPEARLGLLPTRDPMSPLPLPPVGPRALVPGVESPVRTSHASGSVPSRTTSISTADQDDEQPVLTITNSNGGLTRQRDEPLESEISVMNISSSSNSDNLRQTANSNVTDETGFLPLTTQLECHNVEEPDSNVSRRNYVTQVSGSGASVIIVNDDNINMSSTEFGAVENSGEHQPHHNIPLTLPSSSNVTVIEVPPPQSPHYEQLFIPNAMPIPENLNGRVKLERISSSGLIPRVQSRPKREVADENRSRKESHHSINNGPLDGDRHFSSQVGESQQHKAIVRVNSIKDSTETPVVQVLPGSSVSVVSVADEHLPLSSTSHGGSMQPLTAAIQPVPSNLDPQDIPLIGGHQRRRRRSGSSDGGCSVAVTRTLVGADLIRTAPAEDPTIAGTPPLTLRESQVCQLQKEIAHPGGVRLKLRRKDCLNAIALVDIFNSVWVAGWKQREHPLLYNALHVGDELLSVGDTAIRTAADAQKLLKGPSAAMVELVVRRLPLGRVFTLIRARREGDVGLTPDINTPGEVTVEPGGVAARAGLPLSAPTMDGLTLTPWTLTEINGRPLNLFCKVSDVTTRLNSVGKEISVLVQPSDFVKHLRKQLKNIRGYKDYLLQ